VLIPGPLKRVDNKVGKKRLTSTAPGHEFWGETHPRKKNWAYTSLEKFGRPNKFKMSSQLQVKKSGKEMLSKKLGKKN